MKFTEIATLNTRPSQVPASWYILNAPRPLCGSMSSHDQPYVWRGPFIEGIHYAAVDPDDTEAGMWMEENRRLGAVLLRYVTEEYMDEWVLARSIETGTPYEELSATEIRQAYFQECGRREVEIGE